MSAYMQAHFLVVVNSDCSSKQPHFSDNCLHKMWQTRNQ